MKIFRKQSSEAGFLPHIFLIKALYLNKGPENRKKTEILSRAKSQLGFQMGPKQGKCINKARNYYGRIGRGKLPFSAACPKGFCWAVVTGTLRGSVGLGMCLGGLFQAGFNSYQGPRWEN